MASTPATGHRAGGSCQSDRRAGPPRRHGTTTTEDVVPLKPQLGELQGFAGALRNIGRTLVADIDCKITAAIMGHGAWGRVIRGVRFVKMFSSTRTKSHRPIKNRPIPKTWCARRTVRSMWSGRRLRRYVARTGSDRDRASWSLGGSR